MRTATDREEDFKILINDFEVISREKPEIYSGEVIGKTATGFFYVYEDICIGDLADELIRHNDINALAVTKRDKTVTGLVTRFEFFDRVGKQFGRDIYRNKKVGSIMKEAESIYYKQNIFSVVEKIKTRISKHKTEYFILTDDKNLFKGLFSTKDILIYLSEITQKDIQLAKSLQETMVKSELRVDSENMNFIGAAKMAKGVGGDLYMLRKINDHRHIMTLCDVSGKGISASLLSVAICGMINVYDFTSSLAKFISVLNRYIHDTFNCERFVTGIFLKFNELSGKASLYDLGHSYCYLLKKDRFVRIVAPQSNIPMGINREMNPVKIRFKMEKGDIFVALSDGIEEQVNLMNAEYGIKRLAGIVARNRDRSMKEIKDMIFRDIETYRKGQSQSDDMTMFMFRYN